MNETVAAANAQIAAKYDDAYGFKYKAASADAVYLTDLNGKMLCSISPDYLERLVKSDLAAEFSETILAVAQRHLRLGQDQGRRTKGMFDAAIRVPTTA